MTVQGTHPVRTGPNEGLFSAFAAFPLRRDWLAQHSGEHASRGAASDAYLAARTDYEASARAELGLLTPVQLRDATLANGNDAERSVPTYTPAVAPAQSRPPVWFWIAEQKRWSLSPPEVEAVMQQEVVQQIITGEVTLRRRSTLRWVYLTMGLSVASFGLIKLFGSRRN